MEIKYTEDGYLKINAKEQEEINFDVIQAMNTTPYLIPSFRDRYEENCVLYHKGNFISLAEYVKDRIFSFEEFQNLLISILNTLQKAEKDGFDFANTCVSLEYMFIHRDSKEIKLVYIPAMKSLCAKEERFLELIKGLSSRVKTKNAALLIGMLIETANRKEYLLEELTGNIIQASNKNIVTKEKVVEKVVEVPVEKEVEKIVEKVIKTDGNGMLFGMVAIIAEVILGIFIPGLLKLYLESSSAHLVALGLSVVEIIIFLVCIFILRKKKESKKSLEESYAVQEIKRDKTDAFSKEQQAKNIVPISSARDIKAIKSEQNILVKNEIENARISRTERNTNKSISVQNEPLSYSEGTSVLYGEASFNTAYFIEQGKTGLMDRIFIEQDIFVVGRENGVDYRINENSVSKKHAQINRKSDGYYIMDLNSSNGTFLEGKKISDMEKLSEGNQITLGNKIYIFHMK